MTNENLKVIFMGTPDFSVPALQSILRSRHEVVCVYSQPPRGRGRGYTVRKSPVHEAADQAGIEVRTPRSLKKDPQAQQDFILLEADVAVVAAYGLILPSPVLNAPRFGCINIHASLLPRWRGASPIQRAIWSGDAQSGITLMQMEEGLDTGPALARGPVDIGPYTTCESLHDDLAAMGGAMIAPLLDQLAQNGHVVKTPQDDAQSTYAPLLTKEDGRVSWAQSAVEIDRQIRALNPWPGVWTIMNGKRLKILEAEISHRQTDSAPGTVLDKSGLMACGGKTVLRLKQVQPENGRKMDPSSAINGGYIAVSRLFD
ncbi:MAG TPA: methionyl-tRNA formyltransferase [Micavibrio sp.]|jgi:methionyl-tRNA formyltransferase